MLYQKMFESRKLSKYSIRSMKDYFEVEHGVHDAISEFSVQPIMKRLIKS